MSERAFWQWRFKAQLLRVIDGDTLRFRIDLGFHVYQDHNLRLWGINCPELNTVEGKAARDFVEDWCLGHVHASEWPFEMETDKDRESFNRYVGRVQCVEGHSLGEAIVAAGKGALA
jgi:endonuclease YncB( thermonuclease family)